MTTTLLQTILGQSRTESYSGGALAGISVSVTSDNLLRRTNVTAQRSTSWNKQATYAYDTGSGRLAEVSDVDNVVKYIYLANSPLVQEVSYAKASNPSRILMSRENSYDALNRLSATYSQAGGIQRQWNYSYDMANQRDQVISDHYSWDYTYDAQGQLRTASKRWQDDVSQNYGYVAGQQFQYDNDQIGNRTAAWRGGHSDGTGLRQATYSADRVNQYASRTAPGIIDVLGMAHGASLSVTVNNQAASTENAAGGRYFNKELAVNNQSAGVYAEAVVRTSTGSTNQARWLLHPQQNEPFLYDADGNLTNDSLWVYTWDGENRLTKMVSKANVVRIFASGATNSMTQMTLEFSYDYQGRRIRKVVKQGATVVSDQRFVYDGWNVIAVLDSSLNPVASFTWGKDVSGSLQGAGGVGGLVISRFYGSPNQTAFPEYDGNGNIGTLFYDNGGIAAQYEYGPFGELIRATGPLAQSNPFRFSTKYTDDETDLLYYGYRYYLPSLGRWISRDPMGEMGGKNLYGFVGNNPITLIDSDGRSVFWPVVIGLGIVGDAAIEIWQLNQEANEMRGTLDNDIFVQKCEIVIAYGHGNRSDPIRWHIGPGPCRAGGSVTCRSESNNANIVQGVDDGTFFLPVPQNPMAGTDDPDSMAVWDPDNTPHWQNQFKNNPDKYYDGYAALEKMKTDAKERAKSICTRKCCTKVWIRFIRRTINAEDDRKIPFQSDIVVKCR